MARQKIQAEAAQKPARGAPPLVKKIGIKAHELKTPRKVSEVPTGSLTREDVITIVSVLLKDAPQLQRPEVNALDGFVGNQLKSASNQTSTATTPSKTIPVNGTEYALDTLEQQLMNTHQDIEGLLNTLTPYMQAQVFEVSDGNGSKEPASDQWNTYGSSMSNTQMRIHSALNQLDRIRARISFITNNVVL